MEERVKDKIEEVEKYLYVDSFHGIHTSNATTGDFGLEVSVAKLVERGRTTFTRGCMLSGNIFNLFNSIVCIGSESELFDDMAAPKIVFEKISVVS
ncbi:hypothetical protein HZC08_02480 [Candidatus Micrarchaeota archaeon]|nr:hypothetical protein [Candidatus Micrarchaeota archaeon]